METGTLKIGIACFPLIGGSGILATALGSELARRGHEVYLFSYAQPVRLDLPQEGLHFHRVEFADNALFPCPDYTLPLAVKMAEVARSQQLDLFNVHYAVPHALAACLASQIVGHWLHPLGVSANKVLETVFILAQIAVILGFGIFVTYSKHLHIAIAPLNVLFSRRPNGLGPLQPMRSGGHILDFEEADPEVDIFGLGKIEDESWKGFLDLATCTECGRCQSQCPAWVTGKPLSPKQVILDLRDHAFATAPYILTPEAERENLPADVLALAAKPPQPTPPPQQAQRQPNQGPLHRVGARLCRRDGDPGIAGRQ